MPARRPIKPWIDMKQVWPLLKKPGEHIDPGFANFGIRVSPKGKSVWWARYSEGTGQERKQTETTLGLVQFEGATADGVRILDLYQAQEAARGWNAEQKDPFLAAQRRAEREAARAKPLTLKDGFAEFLTNRRTKSGGLLSPDTKSGYETTFKNHLQVAGEWPLLTTTALQWRDLLRGIHKKSASRGMEAMCIVSGIYSHYEMLEYPGLTRNPIRKVRAMHLMKAPDARETHAAPVNLPKLVENIWKLRNKSSRDLLLVYLLGGFRKMAGARLRKSIIDFENGILNVPKGERGWKGWYGPYPLNTQVLGILKERADASDPNVDWLFPARHGDGLPHIGDVRGSLANACKDLPAVLGPHDLRRTFGTVCGFLYSGDVVVLASLLAHKWAKPEDPGTKVTFGYQVEPLEQVRHSSETVANGILEIAGVLPMSKATKGALVRKGINPEKLAVVDLGDDDDEGDA